MKFGDCRHARLLALTLLLPGCGTAPLTESGALSSYMNLKASDGVFTRTRQKVEKEAVLAARSVRLQPTQVSPEATRSGLTPLELALVSNALDRALCSGLSRRFTLVAANQPADLTVQAVITHIGLTDVTSAGLSKGLSVGGAVVNATTGVPVPVPRLPFGLGALSVEAEAKGPTHQSVAAMAWARGADMLTTQTRVAKEADAYALAKQFAADFARFLLTGADPIAEPIPTLPAQRKSPSSLVPSQSKPPANNSAPTRALAMQSPGLSACRQRGPTKAVRIPSNSTCEVRYVLGLQRASSPALAASVRNALRGRRGAGVFLLGGSWRADRLACRKPFPSVS